MAYWRSSTQCESAAGADSAPTAFDGIFCRNPKYAKISKIESVCHGEAISPPRAGPSAFVEGLLMQSSKTKDDKLTATRAFAE
jgi:hypothetical protein